MSHAPLIGVTLDDCQGAPPPTFSRWPHYALRKNYFETISKAGGLPIGLGYDADRASDIMARLDGLLLTGGAFDPDPALYGETCHPSTLLKPERTRAELSYLREAESRHLPVLGLCGGMQLMAIAAGGRLFQHLPEHAPSTIEHEQAKAPLALSADQPSHDILITPGTRLASFMATTHRKVNSSHHQGVADAGTLVCAAHAPDGLIEAVESSHHPFFIGVQWHPEFATDPSDLRLLEAFIETARNFMR